MQNPERSDFWNFIWQGSWHDIIRRYEQWAFVENKASSEAEMQQYFDSINYDHNGGKFYQTDLNALGNLQSVTC